MFIENGESPESPLNSTTQDIISCPLFDVQKHQNQPQKPFPGGISRSNQCRPAPTNGESGQKSNGQSTGMPSPRTAQMKKRHRRPFMAQHQRGRNGATSQLHYVRYDLETAGVVQGDLRYCKCRNR
jgi:hypothetical protein